MGVFYIKTFHVCKQTLTALIQKKKNKIKHKKQQKKKRSCFDLSFQPEAANPAKRY